MLQITESINTGDEATYNNINLRSKQGEETTERGRI